MFMILSEGLVITGVDLLQPVTAQMSSTDGSKTADRCIDGDTESAANHGHKNMCHTEDEGLPWLAIDFGTTVTVKRVEIFNRDDCCGDRTPSKSFCTQNLQISKYSRLFIFWEKVCL